MTSSQHGPYVLGYTHPTMGVNSGFATSQGEANPQKHPQFRLRAAIRPHEAEIASNRRSAGCGEYVLGSCTHRQRHVSAVENARGSINS